MVLNLFRGRRKGKESETAYHGTVEEAIALARETLARKTEDTRTLADVLGHLDHIPVTEFVPPSLPVRKQSVCHACIGLADASEIANRGVSIVGLPDGARGIWQVFALFEDSGIPIYARVFSHEEMDAIDADILGPEVVSKRAYRVPVTERVHRILAMM